MKALNVIQQEEPPLCRQVKIKSGFKTMTNLLQYLQSLGLRRLCSHRHPGPLVSHPSGGEEGAMRPKARRLARHGGPPGWLEESDTGGVILYMMDGQYRLPFSHRTGFPDRSCPAASWWNFQLLLCSKWTQPSVMSYGHSSRPMPLLW
jgi:hypothetical protein